MRTSTAIDELVAALVKAHVGFKPVLRTAKGQVGQNREYKYADLAGLIDATFPALLAVGIVPAQAVDAETQTLTTRLMHTSGQWIESAYPLGKYDRPQDFGSQLSYARRYSLLALLGVAQEDDDGATAQAAKPANGDAGKAPDHFVSTDQLKRLWTISEKKGWTRPLLKAWLLTLGYESGKAIPRTHYDDIVSAVQAGVPTDATTILERAAQLRADMAAVGAL